jgi:hypothetical protein
VKNYHRMKNDASGNPRYYTSAAQLCWSAGLDMWGMADDTSGNPRDYKSGYNEVLRILRPLGGVRMDTKSHPQCIKLATYDLKGRHTLFVKELQMEAGIVTLCPECKSSLIAYCKTEAAYSLEHGQWEEDDRNEVSVIYACANGHDIDSEDVNLPRLRN